MPLQWLITPGPAEVAGAKHTRDKERDEYKRGPMLRPAILEFFPYTLKRPISFIANKKTH